MKNDIDQKVFAQYSVTMKVHIVSNNTSLNFSNNFFHECLELVYSFIKFNIFIFQGTPKT